MGKSDPTVPHGVHSALKVRSRALDRVIWKELDHEIVLLDLHVGAMRTLQGLEADLFRRIVNGNGVSVMDLLARRRSPGTSDRNDAKVFRLLRDLESLGLIAFDEDAPSTSSGRS